MIPVTFHTIILVIFCAIILEIFDATVRETLDVMTLETRVLIIASEVSKFVYQFRLELLYQMFLIIASNFITSKVVMVATKSCETTAKKLK